MGPGLLLARNRRACGLSGEHGENAHVLRPQAPGTALARVGDDGQAQSVLEALYTTLSRPMAHPAPHAAAGRAWDRHQGSWRCSSKGSRCSISHRTQPSPRRSCTRFSRARYDLSPCTLSRPQPRWASSILARRCARLDTCSSACNWPAGQQGKGTAWRGSLVGRVDGANGRGKLCPVGRCDWREG